MKSSARLVFFGTEDFSLQTLKALYDAEYDVAAVVTKPDFKSGRGQKTSTPVIKKLAESRTGPIFQPEKVSSIIEDLIRLKPTHGILVSFGRIIPESVLDIFPGGIINLHPSLLPAYRGPSPIETAILNGDKQTGITLIRLDPGVDEGPIFAQEIISLNGRETKPELYEKLAKAGADFLVKSLTKILDSEVEPVAQDDSKATYTKLLSKDDGVMDWSKPAEILEREVRAFLGWPRSIARVYGQKIIVTKAKVVTEQDGSDLVIKAQPGYLEIQELIAPSGKTMTGRDFILGYKK